MRILMRNTDDKTWQEVLVHIGVLCELFVGIICACAPATAYAFRNPNSIWYMAYHKLLPNQCDTASGEAVSSSGPPSRSISEILKSTDRKYAHYFGLMSSHRRSTSTTNLYVPLKAMLPAHTAPEKEKGNELRLSEIPTPVFQQFPRG